MIKFIATDIDGTLLHSDQTLPTDLPSVIKQLHEKDILFSLSSGRPYLTLQKDFGSISPDILYIADNGSHVVYHGKDLAVHAIAPSQIAQLIQTARSIPSAHLVLCTTHGAYIESEDPDFLVELQKYYVKYTVVKDLSKLQEQVIKFTICDLNGAEQSSYPYVKPYEEELQVSIAGYIWIDCMQKGINKGTAIADIQNMYHLTREECMAFGDYLNDYEMMQQVYYSYAMANAHENLKKVARFTTASNDEDGVLRTIMERCNL